MVLDRLLDFKRSQDVNSPASILTIVVLGTLSVVVLFVAPVLIGAMVELLGFSEAQAGYVISGELAGMSLATFLALYLSSRCNWRTILLAALSCMAMGNIASYFASEFAPLLGLRFLVGIAAGVSMSTCLAIVGLTRDPDRTFGLYVTGQLLFGSLGLYLLPRFFPMLGFNFVYLIVALLIFALLFLLRFLPQGGRLTEDVKSSQLSGDNERLGLASIFAYCGLLAIFVYYVGQYGVWAYLERMAFDSALASDTIGEILSMATIIGILGALSAAILSARYGRILPIGFGVLLSVVSMVMLLGPIEQRKFFIAACILSFTFNFVLPYIMASVANVDVTGRLLILSNLSSGAGLAAGPALAAILQARSGYDAIVWAGIIFTALSLLLIARLAYYKVRIAQSGAELKPA